MLHTFRESFGKYVAIAILGLIAVTFIFFGIDFSVTRSNFAAKVNGTNIPVAEFDRQLQNSQAQFAQNFRIELTDDLRRTLRRQVIDGMILREAMRQQSEDAGYRVSDEKLAQSIRDTEAFQVAGQFSPDVYLSRLNAQGLTPAYYETLQREQLSLLEFQVGVVASTFLTPAEYRRYIELYNERREIAYARFAAQDFMDGIEISDEAVASHYEENASRYMTPETVDIEYVELDLASIAASVELSDEDLRAYYDEEQARFETAEERQVRHILITVDGDDYAAAEAEAAEVLERLEAGEDFAELAAEVSDDGGTSANGGDLGWISRGLLPGPFEDTLFAMEVGQIEGPVETEFGYHILELTDVRRGDVRPFESVRDELREELSRDRAEAAFFDRANELADAAFDAYDELGSVAESQGLPLKTAEGLTRAGDADLFSNSTPIVDAAFDEDAIVSGRNSNLIELSDEDVAVIRVIDHHPPEPEPLEAVADQIREELARSEAQLRAAESAERFLNELGADVDQGQALAETYGAQWNEPVWVERTSTEISPEILSAAFAEAKPQPGNPVTRRVPLGNGDEAVIVVTAFEPGDPAVLSATELEQQRQQLAAQAADLEVAAYAGDVRDRARVRIPDEILDPQF